MCTTAFTIIITIEFLGMSWRVKQNCGSEKNTQLHTIMRQSISKLYIPPRVINGDVIGLICIPIHTHTLIYQYEKCQKPCGSRDSVLGRILMGSEKNEKQK